MIGEILHLLAQPGAELQRTAVELLDQVAALLHHLHSPVDHVLRQFVERVARGRGVELRDQHAVGARVVHQRGLVIDHRLELRIGHLRQDRLETGELPAHVGVDEVDDLLRNNVFVDLYQIVRHALRIGEDSYSIKTIETLYRSKRATDVTTASGTRDENDLAHEISFQMP